MEIVLIIGAVIGGIVLYFSLQPSEKEKEERELRELHDEVVQLHAASYFKSRSDADYAIELVKRFDPPKGYWLTFGVLIHGIFGQEDILFEDPPPLTDIDSLALSTQVQLKNGYKDKKWIHEHEAIAVKTFEDALELVCGYIAKRLPQVTEPSPFVIPLAYTIPDCRDVIDRLFGTFREHNYLGLFRPLCNQLYLNWCQASGKRPDDDKKPLIHATKHPAPLMEVVDLYLAETPFKDFFQEPVALQLRHEEFFSHCHIVGASGSGKTTLIEQLLVHFLNEEDRPSLVVVDSQGDLINKLLELRLPFDPILITPKDIDHPPALNVFDVKNRGYDEKAKEQVTAGVIQTFDFLFSELFGGMDMTGKQQTFFRYSFRLLISLPETLGRNATILDMLELMDNPAPYAAAIARLPDIQRNFFEKDFGNKTWTQTKEQIRYRIQAVIENPVLARLFTSPETKIDLFNELSRPEGSLILVDTAKDFLKSSSPVFGKLLISLVFQAILERAVIPEGRRKDTILVVDEASQYFSTQIDEMLSEVRKYKCGLIAAHQYLDQCSPQLKASLMANTAIKLCGNPSVADATTMSREMRCPADYILSQPKMHFACYVRNVTPQAVSIPVKFGELEGRPKRSDVKQLIARNRERVCSPRLTTHREKVQKVDSEDASQW